MLHLSLDDGQVKLMLLYLSGPSPSFKRKTKSRRKVSWKIPRGKVKVVTRFPRKLQRREVKIVTGNIPWKTPRKSKSSDKASRKTPRGEVKVCKTPRGKSKSRNKVPGRTPKKRSKNRNKVRILENSKRKSKYLNKDHHWKTPRGKAKVVTKRSKNRNKVNILKKSKRKSKSRNKAPRKTFPVLYAS